MILFKSVPQINDWLIQCKSNHESIGFVPTMGALHQGHLSLAELSLENNDHTVVSVFVNPKQFNDKEDLKKYPRTVEQDTSLLETAGVDVLFLPDEDDIYPAGLDTRIDFDPGYAAEVMEGKFRPGHFQGMAEVVYRLLDIVQPDRLYMGQKDFQQLTIVRKMISDLKLPVILEMGPTIREANGLAMSSRNSRLSPQARQQAAVIYATLNESQRRFEEGESISVIKNSAISSLTLPGFEPEYFVIVDGITLHPVHHQEESQFVVACCAVKVEGIRLIDNSIWARPE